MDFIWGAPPDFAWESADPVPDAGENAARIYVDENGVPLTGIRLYNARLKAGEVRPRRGRGPASDYPDRPKPERKPRKPYVQKPRTTATSIIRDAINIKRHIGVAELQMILAQYGMAAISINTISTTRANHLAALRSMERTAA